MIRSSLRPYSWADGNQGEAGSAPAWVEANIAAADTPPMIADGVERTAAGWRSGTGFDPASAYALAAGLVIWEPGPLVAPAAPDGGPEAVIEVEASEFSFSPAQLEVEAGSQVTIRLTNRGVVPHNFAIPALGVLVEAGPGGSATAVMDVPAELTAYDFLCSLPGHYESGMRGTLVSAEGGASPPPTSTSSDAGVATSTTAPPAATSDREAASPVLAVPPGSESAGWLSGPATLAVGGFATALVLGLRRRRSSHARKAADPG